MQELKISCTFSIAPKIRRPKYSRQLNDILELIKYKSRLPVLAYNVAEHVCSAFRPMTKKMLGDNFKRELISKMWIRVHGKARFGEKAEHTH